MNAIRKINHIIRSKPTLEGAGVKLKRVFGYYEKPLLDPFLLLDHFGSANPEDYIAGFPWHPHRGIETVTYMLAGEVEHGDSLGNRGVIYSGDVQWMTAGSGIIHQEMPKRFEGEMRGFQLWVNLPRSHKMMAPRYRDVRSETIPEFSPNPKVKIKIIAGQLNGARGPVQDLVVDTEYFDVAIAPNAEFEIATKPDYKTFAFVFEGSGIFDPDKKDAIKADHLVVFDQGDSVKVQTKSDAVRFLFVSGKPLNEPIAWRGPIVMNTDEELMIAFQEYRNGTFIKT
ncbi:MAG: pirin family protein [candidate division KSB1 bacterium]|nr:pirin family protein [candidate division KSB1 bacterium]MDZ7376537.1 pirin family protein [candidate division KSB1 bacterium]MDZ7400033.1 pirin family protein [candidate division KSB1 bacterium]